MKYGSIIFGILIIFGIFVYTPHYIYAEAGVMSEDINVDMIPSNPEPYTDVTIRISSYATDINSANITWKINNKMVLSGIGKASYTLKTGGANTTTVVSLDIVPDGGVAIKKDIIIRPSEIEMMWQAVNSYTPPFYKGKALPTQEGKIKIVAFPNTLNIEKANKKNMIYSWKLGDDVMENSSGYGKDSLTFTNNILLDREHVGLAVSTVGGSYNAVGSVDVDIEKPKLLFYKKSPINGVLYDEALVGETTMTEDEMTVVAEPYFMSQNSNDLLYSWKINNKEIESPRKKSELSIRPESRGGYATIALTVESITKLFQSITNSIRINL